MSFSFGFAGDDISDDEQNAPKPAASSTTANTTTPPPATATTATPAASAFPVPGKPQLPPTRHDLDALLARLPSKIAYGLLDVALADGSAVQVPRRELWDVRVQLMAEDEDVVGGGGGQAAEGLGRHDVKTGVYEGGFKSWESSVDLVKVLAAKESVSALLRAPVRVVELGCGTALPSVAFFQWACSLLERHPLSLVLADYNPTVLQLVTLPNFLLSWALANPQDPALKDSFSIEGEVELGPDVIAAFKQFLQTSNISLSFLSGGWSQEFVDLLYTLPASSPTSTLLLGAETIYSPFALQAFTETVFAILEREQGQEAGAFVAAKRLYFGVGGSLDDFINKARAKGAVVEQVAEETEGVTRGVVQCILGPK